MNDRPILRARIAALGADPAALDGLGDCQYCGAPAAEVIVTHEVTLERWDLFCGQCAVWCASGATLPEAVADWNAADCDVLPRRCQACGLTDMTVSVWARHDLCGHCAEAARVSPRVRA